MSGTDLSKPEMEDQDNSGGIKVKTKDFSLKKAPVSIEEYLSQKSYSINGSLNRLHCDVIQLHKEFKEVIADTIREIVREEIDKIRSEEQR